MQQGWTRLHHSVQRYPVATGGISTGTSACCLPYCRGGSKQQAAPGCRLRSCHRRLLPAALCSLRPAGGCGTQPSAVTTRGAASGGCCLAATAAGRNAASCCLPKCAASRCCDAPRQLSIWHGGGRRCRPACHRCASWGWVVQRLAGLQASKASVLQAFVPCAESCCLLNVQRATPRAALVRSLACGGHSNAAH